MVPFAVEISIDFKPIVRAFRSLARQLKAIGRVTRRRKISLFEALPPSTLIPSDWVYERRPVDVAHWMPNMPRGHEQIQQGGACVTNADDVLGHNSSKTPEPICLTGAPALDRRTRPGLGTRGARLRSGAGC